MAHFGSVYQHTVVRIAEDFLTKINEMNNEFKGRLSKLGEISELVASIEKEKGEVQETARVDHVRALIKTFCTALLFGPFTELLTKLADCFSIVKEMETKQKEDKSFQFPGVMQVRVDSFKHYLEKAKGRLEVIDKVLDELIEKVSRVLCSVRHHCNRFCPILYHYSLFYSVLYFSEFSWVRRLTLPRGTLGDSEHHNTAKRFGKNRNTEC